VIRVWIPELLVEQIDHAACLRGPGEMRVERPREHDRRRNIRAPVPIHQGIGERRNVVVLERLEPANGSETTIPAGVSLLPSSTGPDGFLSEQAVANASATLNTVAEILFIRSLSMGIYVSSMLHKETDDGA